MSPDLPEVPRCIPKSFSHTVDFESNLNFRGSPTAPLAGASQTSTLKAPSSVFETLEEFLSGSSKSNDHSRTVLGGVMLHDHSCVPERSVSISVHWEMASAKMRSMILELRDGDVKFRHVSCMQRGGMEARAGL